MVDEQGTPPASENEALTRLEELLRRLEEARARLEQTEDPDAAVEVLGELSELARDVQTEVERARAENRDALG